MPTKKKKKGKNAKNKGQGTEKRKLEFKEDMQEYVRVTKMLGDRRMQVMLPDKSHSLAIIPGRFRKRCWMKPGDVLIVSFREFQDDKLDVVYKYNDDEAKKLANMHEIPPSFLDGCAVDDDDEGCAFDIEGSDGDSKEGDDKDCAFVFDDI